MADEEILHRLDLIQAQLAFTPQPDQARETSRADEVIAAILDETGQRVASPELQKRVGQKAKTSARTARDRLPELVGRCVLAVRGAERRAEYRRAGLV